MSALICVRSRLPTVRLAFTSALRKPKATFLVPPPPLTFEIRMVTICTSATPVSGTRIVLPLKVGVPAVAVPPTMAALPEVTAASKVKTARKGAALRSSTPDLPVSGMLMAKVPAEPWVRRDAALSMIGLGVAVGVAVGVGVGVGLGVAVGVAV